MRSESERVSVLFSPLTLTSSSCSWFLPFCVFTEERNRNEVPAFSQHCGLFSHFPGAFIDLQNDHISTLKVIHY